MPQSGPVTLSEEEKPLDTVRYRGIWSYDRGMKFGTEIYSSQQLDDIPLVALSPLNDEIFASYSGPDNGLVFASDNKENDTGREYEVAGVRKWTVKEQKAYGICISLYEQHPVSGKMSGDPVADAFAICARRNSCVMLIADGVNWGEKSRLAARCALYGSMKYINSKVFTRKRHPTNTHDVFDLLRTSFSEAHRVILDREGGLTTLCACMICPVKKSNQYAVCCLNVGDSYGYIFSHNQGIREVTQGSHDVSIVRDIRDAGGALGPVDGKNPELHNLTYGLSFVNQGDIVFLTTDGISDNYDPVVTKIAVARLDNSVNNNEDGASGVTQNNASTSACSAGKPDMEPKERHIYSMKEMERIVHEHELVTEEQVSAQELCSAIVQHVLMLTDAKRKVLENPNLYTRKKLSQTDRSRRDSEIVSKMSEAPGKLDHASIVAFEVGMMRLEDEEMESIPLGGTSSDSSNQSSLLQTPKSPSSHVTSPSTSSKKIRPKKLFNKLRNNLNLGSSPMSSPVSSPTVENSPTLLVSAKRFSFKRSRTRSENCQFSPTSPQAPPLASALSPDFPDYRFPASPANPSPITPNVPGPSRLPQPMQQQFNRKSIAFESSV